MGTVTGDLYDLLQSIGMVESFRSLLNNFKHLDEFQSIDRAHGEIADEDGRLR